MNVGKTLFAQVMEFVPWKTFSRIISRHAGDVGVRTLSCADVFRIMAFSQLTWRESLRDIEVCLTANRAKLFHMGLKSIPARSTLSDALNQRDWRIYHALAQRLIVRAKELYADTPMTVDLDVSVYALDATTIDLCLSLFDWAPFRKTKAAIKLHTLLDLRGAIPAFIHISDGKMHEVNVLDFLPVEAGAFYIMDRGYLDFERLYNLHQVGAFFVTRAKSNMNFRRVYSAPVNKDMGIICDQTICLNGFYKSKEYPEYLRRVRLKDVDTGKTLVFLTNNTTLPATMIAALYKSRWQVELFFKWIKQHLRIKHFLGNSENAVKTQIWCAISTYVLIAIVKKELQLNVSLYTLLQVLSVSVFEKTEISCAFQTDDYISETAPNANQLNLFDF
ncbi:IS4 family transposase [Undibacterium sp. Ji50W]|uniref:IS4 family transposase n=1 Tax=Undibacterium sp. Ji50W TaxID=3413041 RepID=UPI003BF39284